MERIIEWDKSNAGNWQTKQEAVNRDYVGAKLPHFGWGRLGGLDGGGGSFWTGIDAHSCKSACHCQCLSRQCAWSVINGAGRRVAVVQRQWRLCVQMYMCVCVCEGIGRQGAWASCSLDLALVTPPTPPPPPREALDPSTPLGKVVHLHCQSQSLCQLGKHSSHRQNKHLANTS